MRWSAHSHSSTAPRKYERYCFATRTASASSGTSTSITPLAFCTSVGPMAFGLVRAEAAAFDHRGAAHADVRALGRDDHVAAAEQRRVAREAVARRDADQRHQAAQPREQVEREAVEPRHAGAVGVAGPAAAAFGEEHDGSRMLLRQLEQPVLLLVVAQPLRAREHGVVVRHRDRSDWPSTVPMPPTSPSAGVRSISSCERSPPPLRGHDERRVLHEAAVVDEVGDVLARGALPGRTPARDGVGSTVIETDVVALDHLGEVGAHVVEVDRGRRAASSSPAPLADFDEHERVAGHHRVADRDRDAGHDAGPLAPRRRAPSSSTRARRVAGRRARRRLPRRRSTRPFPASATRQVASTSV